jgi:hypothetical protein
MVSTSYILPSPPWGSWSLRSLALSLGERANAQFPTFLLGKEAEVRGQLCLAKDVGHAELGETLRVLRASQALTRSTLSLSVTSVLKLF